MITFRQLDDSMIFIIVEDLKLQNGRHLAQKATVINLGNALKCWATLYDNELYSSVTRW